MSKAGELELRVNGPYPCYVEVSYRDEHWGSIRHDELSDLKYAVEKAMQEARLKLGERYRDEV